MNLPFDRRFILFIFCLLQATGLTGLRLIKVSIPAYKLRGEAAFLECQYELNRTHSLGKHSRNYQQAPYGGNRNVGNNMNFADRNSKEQTFYRKIRANTYQQYQPHQHIQHQQNQEDRRHFYPQEYDQQIDVQQTQTPKSPYGHSVYRGRSMYGGQVGASTFNNDNYIRNINYNHNEDENESTEEEDDEEGEELYAIKWYKDNEEFYRYVPKANPRKVSYRVDGVKVIEEHSDHAKVLLRGLTLNSSGIYRCEISAEAPNFSSVQAEGRMDIVFLPRDGPHIKGQKSQYQIGELLNLNCTSGKSHPASHLQWFINDQPILDGLFLVNYNNTVHKHGLITSTLGLRLPVESHSFQNGAMKVKCLASISPVLWKGGRESILQRRPGIIDNREAMLLVRNFANSLHKLQLVTNIQLYIFCWAFIKICQFFLIKGFT